MKLKRLRVRVAAICLTFLVLLPALHSVGISATALSIKVWTDQPQYQVGETVSIFLSSNKFSQVKLTVVKPGGSTIGWGPATVFPGSTVTIKAIAGYPTGQRTVKLEAWAGSEYQQAISYFTVVSSSPTHPMPPPAGSWTSITWVDVGYDKSHFPQTGNWCPPGSFLTQLDLDGDNSHGPANGPIVGKARCAKWAVYEASSWGQSVWVDVGYDKSHFPSTGAWCPVGSYLTQLDLDGDSSHGAHNGPIVAKARCSKFPGSVFTGWGASVWVDVGYDKSHFPTQGDWCPNGMFLTQLDLDGDSSHGPHNGAIVGKARCTSPS